MPSQKESCNICRKKGHLAKVCKSAKSSGREVKKPKVRRIEEEKEEYSDDDDSEETTTESSESEVTPDEESYSENSEE